MIVNSDFDENFYLSKYADIRDAVKAGTFSSGYAHYLAWGKAEGRQSRFKENSSRPAEWIDLGGAFYQTVLKRMHSVLQPNTYFEVGTLNGDTLSLASCTCISVDPHFQISSDVLGNKPACYFFQVGSDEFFEKHNPIEIFGKAIDIAFLDGMHLFEYLLRDFYNTEQYCTQSSIIVLHDCLPGDEYIAVRDPFNSARQKSSRPNYWTGDVWKFVPVLRRWRPDLKIAVLDAPPTGLVLVTNLDSGNRMLRENYTTIMDTYLNLDLGEYGVEKLHDDSDVISTEDLNCAADFAAQSSIYRGG
jgi:hypothetical protein